MGILLFQGEMILEGGITLVSFPVTVYVSGIRNSMLAKGGKTVGNFRVPGHINFIYRPRIVNVFHFLFFQVNKRTFFLHTVSAFPGIIRRL